ncbi:MAG: hypothetical protein HQL75_09045 [Magnetococcales bacterium]|nr:hypothetical protein [Magnetococcales bacterium]
MKFPTDVNSWLIVFAFFLPGFVSIKVYDLLVPGHVRDFTKTLPEVMGYGALNLLVLAGVAEFMEQPIDITIIHHPFWFVLIVMVIIPVFWPVAFLWLFRHFPPLSRHLRNPLPTAWDAVFEGKESDCWIIVHLSDGKCIGGILWNKVSCLFISTQQGIVSRRSLAIG